VSMIGCFRTATDEEIKALLDKPERILKVFDLPEPEAKQRLLSRLWGKLSQGAGNIDDWQPDPENEDFDVDKAWHGIHFLLAGEAGEGPPPLNFIISGGREIGKIDVGYGPARAFTSNETSSISAALAPVTTDTLKLKCDRAAFRENDIYPDIWEEPDEECFGYVLTYFEALKEFIKRTAEAGKGLLVYHS
jgi:hypothetical protein